MADRARNGGWNGDKPPFGYMSQRRYENILQASGMAEAEARIEAARRFPERGKLYVYDDEAPVLKQLFARYLALNSLRALTRELNAQGMTGRSGAAWRPTILKQNIKQSGVYWTHALGPTRDGAGH